MRMIWYCFCFIDSLLLFVLSPLLPTFVISSLSFPPSFRHSSSLLSSLSPSYPPSHRLPFLHAPQAHSTIGGYLCAQAGEIPSTGEMIVFSGYRFTVVSTYRRVRTCVSETNFFIFVLSQLFSLLHLEKLY